jgi:AAA ATPase-like protein
MSTVPHPEVLSPDFVPPTLFGREQELERLRQLLTPQPDEPVGARCALVRGPSGSGTSSLVRVAARRLSEDVRRTASAEPPLVVMLRVPACRGTHGLAAELVRRLDDGFEPRGFHTMEMLAGFLRRLNRQRRPAIVVLDDVGPAGPDLVPLLRAFSRPDRFLPEGAELAISTWLLLAGRNEAARLWTSATRLGVGPERRIDLDPYSRAELEAIVRDREQRAIGHPSFGAVSTRVVDRAFGDGASAVRALQLLRRELLGPEPRGVAAPVPGRSDRSLLDVEPHLLDALEATLADHPAEVGALRSEEIRYARSAGRRSLPTTTLWRRLLRLESAGLLRRRVRTGGPGGTRSTLELVRPISEWPVRPGPYGTPLGSYASPSRPAAPGPSGAAWPGPGAASPPPARPSVARWGA